MLLDFDAHFGKWDTGESEETRLALANHRQKVVDGGPAADWVRSVDDQIAAFVDEQRMKVFQALLSGRLKAIGWAEFSKEQIKKIEAKASSLPKKSRTRNIC